MPDQITSASLAARLARVERTLDAVLEHLGLEAVDPADIGLVPYEQEALDLDAAGKVIEAIKLIREATGLGLAEAKDRLEELRRSQAGA